MPPLTAGAFKGKLFYGPEQSVPPGAVIPAEPDEPGLAYYMVFGNKAPVAGILRLVPVIAHHPVIIHLKSIAGDFFSVEVIFAILGGKIIMLIYPDGALVDGVVFWRQLQRAALLRHPYRAVIVGRPFILLHVGREAEVVAAG